MSMRSWGRGIAAALLILVASAPATAPAQLGGPGGLDDKLKKKLPGNPLEGKAPITTSLQDAASVAGLLITTEAAISEAPEDKSSGGGMPGGMGGGMGGMGGMDF